MTSKTTTPTQEDINAGFFASLQRMEEQQRASNGQFVGALERLNERLDAVAQPQQQKTKVPVIKTEDIVEGRAGRLGESILERAARIQAAEAALSLGLYEEPEESLSPWEIAGIAAAAALLGGGIAIGVNYALNANSDEG